MAVALQPMLDFSKLKTPAGHAEVLIVPGASDLPAMARSNHDALGNVDVAILDSTLNECRRRVREAIAGSNDQLIIVTGHDPAFIHPGVWAKHVVAARLADEVGGRAVNLVVDSDAPKRTTLAVPSVRGGELVVTPVPYGQLAAGLTYEQMRRWDAEEIVAWGNDVRTAMGDRFDGSQMPTFCQALSRTGDAGDWVDQMVASRRAIEAEFDVAVDDQRISRIWAGPLVLDMLLRADRFASAYNRALADYRRRYRVRGAQRPIPDLHCADGKCETAVWVYCANQPRHRLFVSRTDSTLTLFAGDRKIADVPTRDVSRCDGLDTLQEALGEWRLRPRALALTLWARLLLADLFIHGIGGAKYDRITDSIIADYYELAPPTMACATATLHLDLPYELVTPGRVRALEHDVRDFVHNPQRHLALADDIATVLHQRDALVKKSAELRRDDPRNHSARRDAFNALRQANARLVGLREEELSRRRSALQAGMEALRRAETALGREYFFGLQTRANLERLLDALPQKRDFSV